MNHYFLLYTKYVSQVVKATNRVHISLRVKSNVAHECEANVASIIVANGTAFKFLAAYKVMELLN